MKMKRIIAALTVIVLAAVICLGGFTSCADADTTAGMEADARTMIDGLVAKDFEKAYAVIRNGCTEEQFREFFDYITPFFEEVEDYTLTQTGWNTKNNCNGTYYSIFYKMSWKNGEKIYSITVTSQKGVEGIVGFKVE